jgi:hypothetical protein
MMKIFGIAATVYIVNNDSETQYDMRTTIYGSSSALRIN